MKKRFALYSLSALLLSSCLVNTPPLSTQELIAHICVKDNSYVGLLNFFHFEGKVENYNRCAVTGVELKAILYNCETKQRTQQVIKIPVVITANGSATYDEQFFVGKHMSVQNVTVLCARQY